MNSSSSHVGEGGGEGGELVWKQQTKLPVITIVMSSPQARCGVLSQPIKEKSLKY